MLGHSLEKGRGGHEWGGDRGRGEECARVTYCRPGLPHRQPAISSPNSPLK